MTRLVAAVVVSAFVSLGSWTSSAASVENRSGFVKVGDVLVGFRLNLASRPDAKANVFKDAGRILVDEMTSMSVVTNGNVITATWKGHKKFGENFTVKADITLRDDGGFEYTSFRYSGKEGPLYVKQIEYPLVAVPRTDKTAIFRPYLVGEVYRPDWSKAVPKKPVVVSGAKVLAYSCIALLNEDRPSYYFDMRGDSRLHQPSAYQISTGVAKDTAVMSVVNAVPFTEETMRDGALPFPGVFAPYRGGWYEAARMRRAWLEKQDWFKDACARDFSKLREIALWMWSRGGVLVSEPPVHWFMKETGLKVALDWYWWHNIPYDTNFPYYWPPRDGEDAFRDAVKRMKDAGAFLQVYTNGMLWDMDDRRYDGDDEVVVRPDGKPRAYRCNRFTRHLMGEVCGEAPKFQSMIRKVERTLASTGLDGVYMDMIACCAFEPCCNPHHKHAPGDGSALVKGYRDYVRKVQEDNPGFILSSEMTTETYMDVFKAFIVLYSSWERNGHGVLPRHEPVPAVSVIYRGAAVIFGSFATPSGIPAWDPLWGECEDKPDVETQVAKYPDQFAVEFARGVVWGIQPMVHNFLMKDVTNPRLAKDVQFMKDTARFYYDHRDFLFDGEMLKPAEMKCATKKVSFLAATAYTRPHKARAITQDALPTVFHSEWRAPDGRKAAILVNWTREEQSYELESSDVSAKGTLPPLSWKCVVAPIVAAAAGEDGSEFCSDDWDLERY